MISLLLLCFLTSQGFLLDGSTPLPKAGTVMTDSHFSMLLNLLVDERNTREQLEKIVKQNQQEIANINEKFRHCNCNKQDVNVNAINNKTAQLEQRVDVLQQTVHSVQVINAQIKLKQVLAENNSRNVEKDITGLKQLQSVSDLKTILVLQNKTTNIEMKQQQTENTLQSVLSSANARSQDFLALLNKLKISDNRTIELQGELHNTNNRLNLTDSNLNRRLENQMQEMHRTLNSSLVNIEKILNSSLNNVQKPLDSAMKQLAQISNRVVLSARTSGGSVTALAVIPFKQVHTSHGIHDLTSIKNSGIFTCEKPGLYLISVYVATNANTNDIYYMVYKNNGVIGRAFRHLQPYIITTTVIVTERLEINDTVYVKNYGAMYVYGAHDSIFSILQIG